MKLTENTILNNLRFKGVEGEENVMYFSQDLNSPSVKPVKDVLFKDGKTLDAYVSEIEFLVKSLTREIETLIKTNNSLREMVTNLTNLKGE